MPEPVVPVELPGLVVLPLPVLPLAPLPERFVEPEVPDVPLVPDVMPALSANMRWTSMRCVSVVAALARVLQSACSLVDSRELAQSCVRFIVPLADPAVDDDPLLDEPGEVDPPAVPRLVLPEPAAPDVSGPVVVADDPEVPLDPVLLGPDWPAASAAVLSTAPTKTVPMIFNRMKCAPVVYGL